MVEEVIRCIVSHQVIGGVIGSLIGVGVVYLIFTKLSD